MVNWQKTVALTPLRIVLLYALFGSLWILFSDLLLGQLTFSAGLYTILSITKGCIYVVVTTLLLYWLIRRYEAGRRKAEKALFKSDESLHLALASANQGFFDLDLRTGVSSISPEYALMLG